MMMKLFFFGRNMQSLDFLISKYANDKNLFYSSEI